MLNKLRTGWGWLKRFMGHAWRWLRTAYRDRPRSVIAVIGSAILGTLGFLREAVGSALRREFDSSAWFLALLAVGLSILVLYDEVMKSLNEPNIEQLSRKLRKAEDRFGEIEVELAGVLRLLMREQVFDPNKLASTERVAIYARDQKRFVRLERVSTNRDYIGPGKHFLRDGYGCVGKAWDDSRQFYFCNDLSADREEWINQQVSRFGLRRQEAEQLTMRTRCYASFVLHDSDGVSFAVLVFESTQINVLQLDSLITFVRGDEGKRFARIAARVAAMKKPSIASEAGF